MPYRLTLSSGVIHDASKPHATKLPNTHTLDFETLEEAKAQAKKHGKPPQACKKCGFSSAVQQEIHS